MIRRGFSILAFATSLAGCIVTNPIEFPEVDGIYDVGSCMCALCWDRPFCYDPEASDPDRMFEPVTAGEACPAGFDQRSEPTTRLRQGDTRTGGIHCIRPAEGVELGFEQMLCPTDDVDRAQVEYIDPCLDLPPCAHRSLGVTCPGADSSSPDCPEVQLRPVACGEDDVQARDKLIEACGRHGVDVPRAEPGRYCFLNCVDRDCSGGPSECFECPAGDLDPPHVSPFATRIEVLPSSRAIVFVDGEGADGVDVVGELWLEMPGCGPGMTCTASVPYLRLKSTDGSSLDLGGESARDLRLINLEPIPDSITPIRPQTSQVELDSGALVYGSADIAGVSGRRGSPFTTRRPLVALLRWNTGDVSLNTRLRADSGNASIELSLRGRFDNLPPAADAGPDQLVECRGPDGAPASLSAEASTDPDGPEDLVRFSWASVVAGHPRAARGSTYEPVVPLGEHRFTLNVGDARGAWDLDDVVVTVRDTQPPEIEADPVADCLWPPAHDLRLFRLGDEIRATASDLCDAENPTVRIVDVRSNQPADTTGDGETAPDVRFGSGAFCIRAERSGNAREPRQYTVTLEASDTHGNVGTEEVVVTVPHDERRAARCTAESQPPSVSDDDPRCLQEIVEPAAASTSAAVAVTDAGPPDAGSASSGCSIGLSGRSTALPALVVVCPFLLLLSVRRRRRE